MENMNGYERIKAALEGKMPDQRPVMLHNFMLAAREAGYTMKEYREDPEIAALCHIRFVEKYRTDGILFDVDTAMTASALGAPVDYPEDDPARMHEPMLTSLAEIDYLKDIDISTHPRIQHALETVRILKRHFHNEVFVRGNCDQAPFSLACALRTPGDFMMDLIMDEEGAMRLIDYLTGVCAQFIRLMAKAGADMVSNGDSPAGPSMISPEMYLRFAYPFERKMMEEAHRHGVPYTLHICGNTDKILEHIATMQPDGIELDYLTPLEHIHQYFGQCSALFGTVDPSGVIALGRPEDVRNETRKILDMYADNPRLVIGAGCAIPPMAPEENIRAMMMSIKN